MQIVFYHLHIDAWFGVTMAFNIIFMVDTVLQFNITYFDHHEQHVINSRKRIVKHFSREWLVLDIISIIPYDLIVYCILAQSPRSGEWQQLTCDHST